MPNRKKNINKLIKKRNVFISLLKHLVFPVIAGIIVGIIVFIICSFIIGTLPLEERPLLKPSYKQIEDKIEFSITNDAQRHSATNTYIKLKFIPSNDEEWLFVAPYVLIHNLEHEINLGTISVKSPEPLNTEILLNRIPKKTLKECNISNIGSKIPHPPCSDYIIWKLVENFNTTKEIFLLEIGCDECEKIVTNITINSLITDGCEFNENYTYCWVKEEFLI